MEAKGKILVLIVVVLALGLGTAQGAIVQIAFSGEVIYLDDRIGLFGEQVSLGDTVTGGYVYTTDFTSGYGGADYQAFWFRSPPFEVSVKVKGFEFRSDPVNPSISIAIGNNYTSQDFYFLVSYNNLLVDSDVFVEDIFWQLGDSTLSALSGTALPSTPPNLGDFQSNDLYVKCIDYGQRPVPLDSYLVTKVTSVTLIPEPCTLGLLGVGAVLLLRRR